MSALSIAYFGQKSNQRMLNPVSQVALYWHGVAATGEIDEEKQKILDTNIADAMSGAKWPSRQVLLHYFVSRKG